MLYRTSLLPSTVLALALQACVSSERASESDTASETMDDSLSSDDLNQDVDAPSDDSETHTATDAISDTDDPDAVSDTMDTDAVADSAESEAISDGFDPGDTPQSDSDSHTQADTPDVEFNADAADAAAPDSQSPPCQPSDGPCCTDQGAFEPSVTICARDAVQESRCLGETLCGATIERRTRDVRCSGSSAECSGTLSEWSSWTQQEVCGEYERCTAPAGECVVGTLTCDPRNPDYCTEQLDFTPCDDGVAAHPIPEDLCFSGTCRPLACGDRTCNPTGPGQRVVAGTGRFSVDTPADNGDVVAIDQDTGLWWEQSVLIGTTYTFDGAVSHCANLEFAGMDDWRLPDCHEASAVIDWWRTRPAIDPSVFDVVAQAWSWTSCAEGASSAIALNVTRGDIGSLSANSTQGAWCVRGTYTPTYGPASPRFTALQPNGSALSDSATGLIWEFLPSATPASWAAATQYCQDLTAAGVTNWRLPHIDELSTLIDFSRSADARTTAPFPPTQHEWYWTSTQHYNPPNTGSAWQLDVDSSRSQPANKDFPHGVRCVASP
jgi:hypothetical protein